MTSFIIAATLLTLFALSSLLWTLLRRKGAISDNRRALNAAVYRDQLLELEREHAEGSLADEDYTQAQDEVQRRLLEDTDTRPELLDSNRGRKWVWTILLLIPLVAAALYVWHGESTALNPQRADAPEVTDQQIKEMVTKLAAKLEADPNNPEGWAMLARSYMNVNRPVDAASAFSHIEKQVAEDPSLMVDYAEALLDSTDPKNFPKARALVGKALSMEPGHPKGLFIAGGIALMDKDLTRADTLWEKLLPLLEPGSQDFNYVLDSVNRVRVKLKKPALKAEQFNQTQGPVTQPTATANTNANAPTKAGSSSVAGLVELDAALKAKTAPTDTVFVFARAVSGPRMPLAILKTTVSALPLDFELTEAMAMSPQYSLSTADMVRVEVRVSKAGSATPMSGDLMGASLPVKPGSRGVSVKINAVQP
jgi:cytochrome c-type biogenesis protein CcmH